MNQQPLFEVQILPVIQYRCPDCGSTDLRVECAVTLTLVQPDNHEPYTDLEDFDQIHDAFTGEGQHMLCNACEREGSSAEFLVEE